jgi:hypothetical protein
MLFVQKKFHVFIGTRYLYWTLWVEGRVNNRNVTDRRTRRSIQHFDSHDNILTACRSQSPRGLRRRSTAARLLRSWVRISPRAWMFVCCVCCALLGRVFCDEMITRPRGVLPTVARRCVWLRNLVNEEAIARAGLQSQRKYRIYRPIRRTGP